MIILLIIHLAVNVLGNLSSEILKNESNYLMFWRLQKVGSSTISSILLSYAYRYNLIPKNQLSNPINNICARLVTCLHNSTNYSQNSKIQKSNEYIISTKPTYVATFKHEICNLPVHLVFASLPCVFTEDFDYMNDKRRQKYVSQFYHKYWRQNTHSPSWSNIKEIFIVRNPLCRIVSIYYWYGAFNRIGNQGIQYLLLVNKFYFKKSNF